MPRKARIHTAATIAKLKPPASGIRRVAVGGVAGLEIQISASGARSWVLRGSLHGKRVNRGLGSTDDLSLAQARDKAREIRACWREGRDPAREMHRIITFGSFWPDAVEALTASLTNVKARAQWSSTIRTYAEPVLGSIPLDQISVSDIVAVLQPIWTAKADTASKVRGRLEAIIDRAIALEHRSTANPAQRALVVAVLGRQVRKATGQPAVRWTDAPAFWADLSAGKAVSHAALRLLTLTATRSGEVRGATWSEIDLVARVWTIPSNRTKTRITYRVPLTDAAMAQLPPPGQPDHLVFPGPGGKVMSENTLGKAMKTITAGAYPDPDSGKPAVPHGLRATFRTWAQEQHIDREIAEACLAHISGNGAEQAYKRSDQIEARRAVLDSWANFLDS